MKCENCEKDHDGSYGSGRFCSVKCARGFSTKNSDSKELKEMECVVCKKKIFKNKRADPNRVKCTECNKIYKGKKGNIVELTHKKYCKYCGALKGKCKRPSICKKYRVIPSLEKYFEFDFSAVGTEKIYEEFDRIKNLLLEEYWDNELSSEDIAVKYGASIGGPNLIKIMRALGITTFRTLAENQFNRSKHKGISTASRKYYKNGWHTAWNNEKVFYRSSYELEFAQDLDEQEVAYKMEDLRIVYWDSQLVKKRVALPDFYLPETNEIIEIKSLWTYDEQNMKDRVKAYREEGYGFKLILEKKEVVI